MIINSENHLKANRKHMIFLIGTLCVVFLVGFQIESDIYYYRNLNSIGSIDKSIAKLMFISELFQKIGNYDIPVKIYDYLILIHPEHPDIQDKRFWVLFNAKKLDEANKFFDTIEIKRRTIDPYSYAEIAIALHRYSEVKIIFDILVEQTPSYSLWAIDKRVTQFLYDDAQFVSKLESLFQSARQSETENKLSDALLSYEKILEIDRINMEALTGKTRIFVKEEQFDQAADMFQKIFILYEFELKFASSEYPDKINIVRSEYINSIRSLALMHENDSDFGDALTAYSKITSIDQFNIMGLEGKARMLEKLNRIDESIRVYELLYTLQPDNKEYADKIKLLNDSMNQIQ